MSWEDFLIAVINNALPVLLTAITAILSYIGTKLKKYLDKKENADTIKEVVRDTIQYVEQIYKDLKGEEKLEKALDSITNQLQAKGITVTTEELKIKIEAAVYELTKSHYEQKKEERQ